MAKGKTLRREDITDNTPLRLAAAAEIAFPDGTMTVSGLRKERDSGRLAVERIAGKEYTTLAAIEEMRHLCRDQRKAHGSTPNLPDFMETARSTPNPSGSSETDRKKLAQASALAMAHRLRQKPSKPLANTSSPATNQPASVIAMPLRSSSQT